MRGETTLDDLNLPPKQIRAAEDFMKNLDSLDPKTRLEVIKHVTQSLKVATRLREMGMSDPEQGFGLLFGLNTLRAIEPEMIMQGVARRGKGGAGLKESLLKQVSLEDYYATKVRHTKQLQKHFEELLAVKRKNLIGAAQRGETIRTEVDSHIAEVRDMLGILKKEQIQSVQLLKDLNGYNIERAGDLLGDKVTQEQIERNIKIMEELDPENAMRQQKKYSEAYVKETNNQIDIMKQAAEVAKQTESANKVIVSTITKRIKDVAKVKNDLYTEAGDAAVNQIVDGTQLVRELSKTLDNISSSEQFAGGIQGVVSDLDDILAEPAKIYIANAAKNANISEIDFKNGIAEAIKQGDKNLTTEAVSKIVNSPTKLLMYLSDAETEVGGLLSEIPAFKFSGKDLKNIELGLTARINKGGEFSFGQSAKQKYQLLEIVDQVKTQIKDLEDSGNLDMTKWNKANAENVKYHDMLATDIVSKTWGTRVRSVGPEENWQYKTKQEKWANKIIGAEDVELAKRTYDEIDMIFGNSAQGKQFTQAFNYYMVARVQDNFSKGVNIKKMEPEKIISYGSQEIKQLNKGAQKVIPNKNFEAMDRTLNFIRRLEEKSDGRFNFERAYNFEGKLTNSIKKSKSSLDSLEYAEGEVKKAKGTAEQLQKVDADQFEMIYKNLYDDYKSFKADPSVILGYMQSGNLTNMKKTFVDAGMDGKVFDKHVHTLFVDGFLDKYVARTGQIAAEQGEFKNVNTLNGQEVIEFLEKNKKVIKEFIPDLNIEDISYLAQATALKQSGDVIEKEGIDSVTAGLTKLTVGSYVSRLYAVASNRTSLRYVGAEALVVQMKRDEVSTLAALMMNPKAAEKIAEIVKSGKPMSHRITTSEAAWLPNFIGEFQAISERYTDRALGYDEETKTQEKTSSSLPADEAMATETAFLEKSLQEENRAYEQAYQAEQDAFARDMQNNIALQ